MNMLKENWLTDGWIDFEYKKYLLLAYLQGVSESFDAQKLYPHLGELVGHYQNLQHFIQQKRTAEQAFPKKLNKLDWRNFMLKYEEVVQDDQLMSEIERIVDFSLPVMKRSLDQGRSLYECIEEEMKLMPVGIVPLELSYGYLLVRNGIEKEAKVFQYKVSQHAQGTGTYQTLATRYISSYTTGIVWSYEHIKLEVLRKNSFIHTPAFYVVESSRKWPFTETVLPLARRLLLRHVIEASKR